MTSKRNSRVYNSDASSVTEETMTSSPSSYRSRRNSRSSGREDFIEAAQEAEEGRRTQHSGSIGSESSSSSSSASVKAAEAEVKAMANASQEDQSDPFSPPIRPVNFGVVFPGVYRSSYPKSDQFSYLKSLDLKTVVTLVKKDEMDHDLVDFLSGNGINQVIFNMKGTKKEAISAETMSDILKVVLDHRNYPLMIHCNHGKHRTGCVVSVMRKIAGWDGQRVLDEYREYAAPKIRECDVDYIRNFEASSLCLPPAVSGVALNRYSRFNPIQMRAFTRGLMVSFLFVVLWLFSGPRMMVPGDTDMA